MTILSTGFCRLMAATLLGGLIWGVFAPPTSLAANKDPDRGAHILLTDYYVLPGESFKVKGARFRPNETVEVEAFGETMTVEASGSGAFLTDEFVAPWSAADAKVWVTAVGAVTPEQSIKLAVGTYYPFARPAKYAVKPATKIKFSGRDWAPDEEVEIKHESKTLGLIKASGGGSFLSDEFGMPSLKGTYFFSLTGDLTHKTSTVKITVY